MARVEVESGVAAGRVRVRRAVEKGSDFVRLGRSMERRLAVGSFWDWEWVRRGRGEEGGEEGRTVMRAKRDSVNFSSVVRAFKTSASSERLMSIVMAFLAIGYRGGQFWFNMGWHDGAYRVVFYEKFEISDGL